MLSCILFPVLKFAPAFISCGCFCIFVHSESGSASLLLMFEITVASLSLMFEITV